MACPCGVEGTQPWRTRRDVWSPASLIGGLILVVFGVLILSWGVRPAAGFVLLGALGVSVVASWIVQARRGHRGWCLLRRGAWFGLALPGAPLRLLF